MASLRFNAEIVDKTTGEIRTFLDAIANGTSGYRSLYNLTEHVEHQYHGRFLIELIQNAHDALNEQPEDGDQGRVEIIFSSGEDLFGVLYVANDGQPFTQSNFNSLSNFGQSDKDPEKHIGNKGIGFRSVLEISDSPEIYSRRDINSNSFDGYCFYFKPGVVTSIFENPIRKLLTEDSLPSSPLDQEVPLVLWGDEQLKAFQARVRSAGPNWIMHEMKYLSPYSLPLPLDPQIKTPFLERFEKNGLATVIRLPFKSKEARELALRELNKLDENAVIFLHRLKSLWIDLDGVQRLITRKKEPLQDNEGGWKIKIEITQTDCEDNNPKIYWLWEDTLGGKENPEEAAKIQAVVEALPGKWPELRKATIALAAKSGGTPDDGKIYIFLPTEIPSGCAVHLSGPFYGDISRRKVYLDSETDKKLSAFNNLLLTKVAEKTIDVIINSLADKGIAEASAIIDLLVPISKEDESAKRWWNLVNQICIQRGIELTTQPFAFSETGWNSFRVTRLLPENELEVINEDILRAAAAFPVFVAGLTGKKRQLEYLYKSCEMNLYPSNEEIAEALAQVAKRFHKTDMQVYWTPFWRDVAKLLPGQANVLKGKKILLGTDNELHATDETCSVFFRPRTGGMDDEVLTEKTISAIPENLRSFVAFLHESIQVNEPRPDGGIQATDIHRYLSSVLVQPFGVEHILRNVLIKAMPPLPLALGSNQEGLCRDILHWGLRLVANLVAKDKGEKTLSYLGKLPVPCLGGWYPMEEACFGPGWEGCVGEKLYEYLRNVHTKHCQEALSRLLLASDHPLWGGLSSSHQEILTKAGVFDGLRLIEIGPNEWEAKLYVSGGSKVRLPETPPPYIDSRLWDAYIQKASQTLEPKYGGWFQYEVQKIFIFPGMDQQEHLDSLARKALMHLLLRSLPTWPISWRQRWDKLRIKKLHGEDHTFEHLSPLHFWLRETRWLVLDTGDDIATFRPDERWYISSLFMAGNFHQFTHLNPIPGEICAILEKDLELAKALEGMGMPKFDPENATVAFRLLNDLATAWETHRDEISDINVFLGQIRMAWKMFRPDPADPFPKSLIIRHGPGSLRVVTASPEEPVYLPDAATSFNKGLQLHGKPIVAIDETDALRLAVGFKNAYHDGIRQASELDMKPIVDREPWTKKGEDLLAESELKWLMPVLLSIVAFAGDQALGVHTKKFSRAIETLRKAKICWVTDLKAGLWQGEELIASTPVPALWLSGDLTLLSEANNLQQLSRLSEALEALLDRRDLNIPLKLVLSNLTGAGPDLNNREKVYEALKELKISESHVGEVEHVLLGDLGWTIRLLRPLLLSLNPKLSLGSLAEIRSEEELRVYLETQNLSPLTVDDAICLVRRCDGFQNLGKELFTLFGDNFQLEKWNQVLTSLRHSPAKNEEAKDQFKTHLLSAYVPLLAMLRKILIDHPEVGKFTNLADQVQTFDCPTVYEKKYWVIDFKIVMQTIRPLFEGWKASPAELEAIDEARSIEDFLERLNSLGLEPAIDPNETYAQNFENCRRSLEKFQQTAIIWGIRNDKPVSLWESEVAELLDHLNESLDPDGFLYPWNEERTFKTLANLPRDPSFEVFWEKMMDCSRIEDFLKVLSISEADIKSARDQLDEFKERIRAKKRLIHVCGKDFDSSEDNLDYLWNHISDGLKETDLPKLSLQEIANLREWSKKGQPQKREDNKKKRRVTRGRMSAAMEKLIGLAGEIHAYRIFLRTYGPSIINSNCWVSENSLRKFPQNAINDELGYDFEINIQGKTYHIEVKASEGNDEIIKLGVSQIKHAKNVANKKNIKFLIFHITKALSMEPSYTLLPNPYERQYEKLYDIQEADLRIRYKKT